MVRTKQKNVRLVAVMAEKCLSGRDLARQVHVHPNTISAILNVRQDPTAETARGSLTKCCRAAPVWRIRCQSSRP